MYYLQENCYKTAYLEKKKLYYVYIFNFQGSIVVEVGSEKCDSEGNYTELENTQDINLQGKDQIETLKGNFCVCFLIGSYL